MAESKAKVGIIGVGYVGGALRHWFESQPELFQLFLYDKHKSTGSLEEVNQADIIFVAVPTPFHNDGRGYDDSAVQESAANVAESKIIVIKSTVLPGTTAKLQEKYPKKTFIFNPEFLRARHAVEDFLHPTMQIIGHTAKSRGLEKLILDIMPPAPSVKIISSTEAEICKYFENVFLANRVIFANQVYDLCQKVGANYNLVKEAFSLDPRIGSSHFDVFADGYRGYGGHCLPKDVRAITQFAKSIGVNLKLLDALEDINRDLSGDDWREA